MNGPYGRVTITDKFISFINTLQRTNHENINSILSSFITMVIFNRNWSMQMNRIPENYEIFNIPWHNSAPLLFDEITNKFLTFGFSSKDIESFTKSLKQFDLLPNSSSLKGNQLITFISEKLNVSHDEINDMIKSFNTVNSYELLNSLEIATRDILSYFITNMSEQKGGNNYRKYMKYKKLYMRLKQIY